MKTKEAIEILISHNEWRRGDDDKEMTNPYQLGEAIDLAIRELKKVNADKLNKFKKA